MEFAVVANVGETKGGQNANPFGCSHGDCVLPHSNVSNQVYGLCIRARIKPTIAGGKAAAELAFRY
jgi:hypothetical protein